MAKNVKRMPQRCGSATAIQAIPKVPTGISGLDSILDGGLPQGKTSLISGGPGTGKSILGLEFIYRGALEGEPGIFITFEERAESIRKHAFSLGWDLAPLEEAGKLFILDARLDPAAVLSGDFTLKGLFAIIAGQTMAMGARRIVIDALDVLLRIYEDPVRERGEIYSLHNWLDDAGLTAVLTLKTQQDKNAALRYEFLDFMVDCVIRLDSRVDGQISTRRLQGGQVPRLRLRFQ